MSKLPNKFNSKFQTLTYFGFDKRILFNLFFEKNQTGIDRIVPIGRSMEMNFIWDGYDLAHELTRKIDIK